MTWSIVFKVIHSIFSFWDRHKCWSCPVITSYASFSSLCINIDVHFVNISILKSVEVGVSTVVHVSYRLCCLFSLLDNVKTFCSMYISKFMYQAFILHQVVRYASELTRRVRSNMKQKIAPEKLVVQLLLTGFNLNAALQI